MKTDELISMLATGDVSVEPHAAARRYAAAIGGGALGVFLLVLAEILVALIKR
jgi:hypothetical protein